MISDKVIKVGIAEDHPLARRGLVDLMGTAEDMRVIGEASDGIGAIGLANDLAEKPDVILVDVRMPGVSGLEVTRRITEENPGVAVIILTAMDDPQTMSDAVKAGAKAYVLKTADADEVLDTVRIVAHGHVVIDSKTWGALTAESQAEAPTRSQLSRREMDVIGQLAEGRTNKQIGEELGISPETVKTHVDRICKRLGASDRTDAVAKALRTGIIN